LNPKSKAVWLKLDVAIFWLFVLVKKPKHLCNALSIALNNIALSWFNLCLLFGALMLKISPKRHNPD
jgi:hypothetical protein